MGSRGINAEHFFFFSCYFFNPLLYSGGMYISAFEIPPDIASSISLEEYSQFDVFKFQLLFGGDPLSQDIIPSDNDEETTALLSLTVRYPLPSHPLSDLSS